MEELTPHPQAEILRAIADGKTIQRLYPLNGGTWTDSVTPLCDVVSGNELRIKPQTITINGHEVPCPVREPLKNGKEFWLSEPTQQDMAIRFEWSSTARMTHVWFERGLIHLTKEAAVAHAEALLSFTRSDK